MDHLTTLEFICWQDQCDAAALYGSARYCARRSQEPESFGIYYLEQACFKQDEAARISARERAARLGQC